MRYFFDTEFLENGETIRFISIGIAAEDGREYYAESPAAKTLCIGNDWLMENVQPYLQYGEFMKSRGQVAEEIIDFCGPHPEFWAYYADYDWVVMCQLYGRMIDLPHTWPKYCRDLKQLLDDKGRTLSELHIENTQEHHALSDAKEVRAAYAKLQGRL